MEAHMKRYLCEIIVCLHNKLLTIPRYANEIQHFSGPLSMLGLSTDKMRKHVLVFLTKLFYLKTRRYFILFTTEKLALYHCLSLEYILNHAITWSWPTLALLKFIPTINCTYINESIVNKAMSSQNGKLDKQLAHNNDLLIL